MNEKPVEFLLWVKTHKKQLIITAISITAIAGIILGFKSKDVIIDLWEAMEKNKEKIPETIPTEVSVVQATASTIETVEGHRSYTAPQSTMRRISSCRLRFCMLVLCSNMFFLLSQLQACLCRWLSCKYLQSSCLSCL